MKVLVALYADLELYPPSLNAVLELAARVQHVHVVLRSLGYRCATLPDNVTIWTAVSRAGEAELRRLTAVEKASDFAHFVRCLRKVRSEGAPQLVVAFDPVPLLAVRLSGKLGPACLLWYHNHDKEIRNPNRRFSVGWWAYATEAGAFRHIDFFSVPASERLPLFQTKNLARAPAILPNFPSRQRAGRSPAARQSGVIRLVYQGSLGRHHGFSEIVPWLGRTVSGKRLQLTLVGKIDENYRRELLRLAQAHDVCEWFEIRYFVPFTELPRVLESFDIGLAIHEPIGVTYSTGGTACNKIYEYAAAGLPVVLYDSQHYRQHLGSHSWVAFCRLTWDDFSRAVAELMDGLDERSNAATSDIQENLNYETAFQSVWDEIMPMLQTLPAQRH